MIINGCIVQQSQTRLPNRSNNRSDGRSQGRLQPACAARVSLTAGHRGGYLTHYSNRTPREPYSLSDQVLSFTHDAERLKTRAAEFSLERATEEYLAVLCGARASRPACRPDDFGRKYHRDEVSQARK